MKEVLNLILILFAIWGFITFLLLVGIWVVRLIRKSNRFYQKDKSLFTSEMLCKIIPDSNKRLEVYLHSYFNDTYEISIISVEYERCISIEIILNESQIKELCKTILSEIID